MVHAARQPRTIRRLARIGSLALAALLAGTMAACGPTAGAGDAAEPAGNGATQPADTEALTSTALVVTFGEGQVLFVDQDTEAPYYPTLPEGGVFAADGTPLEADELTSGNVVRVTGNGIMLESYPAQYPGIERVEVVDEGDPADAATYDELVASLWAEPDPTEPPYASLEYRTELAVVSTAPLTCSSTWAFELDGEAVTTTTDAPHPVQYEADGMPDVRVDAAAEVVVSFDRAAVSAAVTRWSEADIAGAAARAGSVHDVNPDDLACEPVASDVADGSVTLSVEPGYRYALDVAFDAGTVTYVFTAPAA